MKIEKVAASWMIFVGFSITMLWIILYSTNSVNEDHISFILHLAAEGLTALFSIVVGLSLLLNKKSVRPSMFLTFGLIIASAAGAGGFYLSENVDFLFFGILEAIAGATLILFLLLYLSEKVNLASISIGSNHFDSRFSKLVNFVLGLAIYTILNGATAFGETENWIMVVVHLMATVLLFYIHFQSIGRKVIPPQDSNQLK